VAQEEDEVFAARADAAGLTADADAPRRQDGPAVPLSERRQAIELPQQVLDQDVEVRLRVDAHARDEVVVGQGVPAGGLESLGKPGDVGRVEAETDGLLVPAETDEPVATRRQRREEVEARDAASRPLGDGAVGGNEDDGTMVKADEPAGDDADDPGVPAGVGQDDGAPAVEVVEGGDGLLGLLDDLLLGLLSPAVEGIEFGGDGRSTGGVSGGEEFGGEVGVSDAAGGIEARRQLEGDVAAGD